MTLPLINIRFILLISASFIAIFSSIAIYFCLPILISHVIRTQVTLSTTSGSFENWRLNSVIDRMYLYNITNLRDLNNDSAEGDSANQTNTSRKVPKLDQIGPITFRQDREKLNIRFDSSNETVIYDQKKSWTFLPELSSLKSLDDLRSSLIYHISVPLAGTTLNPEYAEFINPTVAEQQLRLFLNHSVDTLLFEGYYDILMEQAKSSGQIDVDRFGWLHNQNNSIVRSMRVFTGPSNATLDKFGLIDQFGQRNYLDVWRNNNSDPNDFQNVRCNDFRLSSAGEFFPPPEHSIIAHNNYYKYAEHHQQLQDSYREIEPTKSDNNQQNLVDNEVSGHQPPSSGVMSNNDGNSADGLKQVRTKAGKYISIFMPELCRTIRLFYNGSYNFKDILHVDRYIANAETFKYRGHDQSPQSVGNNSIIESNKCYCNYDENTRTTNCPPNGMMDLFSCRKGSPITISFPHFLYSTKDKSLEPYLRLFIDELGPNEEEHQFFIDLESTLNLPVNVQIVLQFNVHVRNVNALDFTRNYSYLFEYSSGNSSSPPLEDFYLPQMWVKSTAQVDENNLAHLVFIQKHLKLVTPLTTIVIFGFASILLLASAKLAFDLTYGPQSTRKSSTCDHESCSSFNGSHSCSYLRGKKKYLDMELFSQQQKPDGKSAFKFASSMGNIPTSDYNKTSLTNRMSFDESNCPTTSKKNSNFVIASTSSDSQHCCESQPLNE